MAVLALRRGKTTRGPAAGARINTSPNKRTRRPAENGQSERGILKTAIEAATLIGVVAALIAGAFYALGTVAMSSYYAALGFDAHQFPSFGLELQVRGFAGMAMATTYIGVFIVILAGAIAAMKRLWQKFPEPRAQKRWSPTTRLVLLAIICAAFMIVIFTMTTGVERASALGPVLALPILFFRGCWSLLSSRQALSWRA